MDAGSSPRPATAHCACGSGRGRAPAGRRTPPIETSFLVLEGDVGGAGYAQFSPDGNSIAATYWKNTVMLWRLWSPDAAPDPAIERVWGADRARLALIREAVRFRRDNGLEVRVEDADLSE